MFILYTLVIVVGISQTLSFIFYRSEPEAIYSNRQKNEKKNTKQNLSLNFYAVLELKVIKQQQLRCSFIANLCDKNLLNRTRKKPDLPLACMRNDEKLMRICAYCQQLQLLSR